MYIDIQVYLKNWTQQQEPYLIKWASLTSYILYCIKYFVIFLFNLFFDSPQFQKFSVNGMIVVLISIIWSHVRNISSHSAVYMYVCVDHLTQRVVRLWVSYTVYTGNYSRKKRSFLPCGMRLWCVIILIEQILFYVTAIHLQNA